MLCGSSSFACSYGMTLTRNPAGLAAPISPDRLPLPGTAVTMRNPHAPLVITRWCTRCRAGSTLFQPWIRSDRLSEGHMQRRLGQEGYSCAWSRKVSAARDQHTANFGPYTA